MNVYFFILSISAFTSSLPTTLKYVNVHLPSSVGAYRSVQMSHKDMHKSFPFSISMAQCYTNHTIVKHTVKQQHGEKYPSVRFRFMCILMLYHPPQKVCFRRDFYFRMECIMLHVKYLQSPRV